MPTRSSTSKPATAKKTTTSKRVTTTKRSTASKSAAAPSASKAPKPAPAKTATPKAPASVTAAAKAATANATPATVTKLEPVVSGPALRKKELFDTVAQKTGMKRAEVKKVVEAALATMGLALQESRDLNLQPFGTVKINRERKLPEGKVVVTRIRQARELPLDDAPVEPAKTPSDSSAKTAAE